MADDADVAQAHEEARRDNALARARARLPKGVAARDCTDCGERIPVKRRKAVPGCSRCVACEEIAERKRRLFRGLRG